MLPEERQASSNPATQISTTVELVKALRPPGDGRAPEGDRALGRLRARRRRLLSIGIVVLVVGLLRLLQHVGDDVFYGFWSIVPYLIALVVCGLVVALA